MLPPNRVAAVRGTSTGCQSEEPLFRIPNSVYHRGIRESELRGMASFWGRKRLGSKAVGPLAADRARAANKQFLEVVGLPGSGKHLIKKFGSAPLSFYGWTQSTVTPIIDATKEETFTSTETTIDAALNCLLLQQVRRLSRDGCRQPWLGHYHAYCTINLLQSRQARREPIGPTFLDESLLHHFGPELVELSASHANEVVIEDFIGAQCAVIHVVAPRPEVLERLEERRGLPIHWDWASAYGERLNDFLDVSEERIQSLINLLKDYGVQVATVEILRDAEEAAVENQIADALDGFDRR